MTQLDDRCLQATLTDLLDDLEVPVDGPARILQARDRLARPHPTIRPSSPPDDAQFEKRPEPMQRAGGPLRSRRRKVLAAAAVIVVVAAAAGAIRLGHRSAATVAGRPFSAKATAPGTVRPSAAQGSAGAISGGPASTGASAAGGTAVRGTPVAPVAPPVSTTPTTIGGGSASVPALPSEVVQTGSISVRVDRDGLQAALSRLGSLATGLGGFVQSSSSDGSGTSATGSSTLRVPVAQFDQLLSGVKQLGRTLSVSTSGQDVTSQDVDLAAQIQALQATRTQYLQILAKAQSIADILSVEQQITPIETQIEQLLGQQQVLENRAQYGTLSVDLSEAPPKPAPKPAPVTTSGLSRAWAHARHSFTHGMESVVSATGGIAVFALCAIVVGVLGRLGWRVLRRRLV
jgi:hypothetical protein